MKDNRTFIKEGMIVSGLLIPGTIGMMAIMAKRHRELLEFEKTGKYEGSFKLDNSDDEVQTSKSYKPMHGWSKQDKIDARYYHEYFTVNENYDDILESYSEYKETLIFD